MTGEAEDVWSKTTIGAYLARAEEILQSSIEIIAIYVLRLLVFPAVVLGLVAIVFRRLSLLHSTRNELAGERRRWAVGTVWLGLKTAEKRSKLWFLLAADCFTGGQRAPPCQRQPENLGSHPDPGRHLRSAKTSQYQLVALDT